MDFSKLSLREKIGQLFMIGFYGEELPPGTETFIETNNIGFVILFSRNIGDIGQVANLNNHIHQLKCPLRPAIFVDQEGGLVVRFGEKAATVISHMGIAATGDPHNAELAARIIAREMKSFGIDGVLAPVLDVNFEPSNPVIGTRSFSADPEVVVTYAREFVRGLNSEGMPACGKHFPGHGATVEDSHLEIPVTKISPNTFFQYCFSPFAAAASWPIDAIMSAHVRFPRLDDRIATFSPYFIQELLRQESGFDGVVFSDCLEMAAVKDNFRPQEIAENCIIAGIDVLCPSHHLDYQQELFDALIHAVRQGRIPEKRIDQSLERVIKLKDKYGMLQERKPVDPRNAVQMARASLAEERRLATASVTLVHNRQGIIPIHFQPGRKYLLLEWISEKASTDFSLKKAASLLGQVVHEYLPGVNIDRYQLISHHPLPSHLSQKLQEYEAIIACPYSLNPGHEEGQAIAIRQILQARPDLVVAATGNPYDIRCYPGLDTYIVTYGARKVQLEALFALLSGQTQQQPGENTSTG